MNITENKNKNNQNSEPKKGKQPYLYTALCVVLNKLYTFHEDLYNGY